MKKLQQIKVQTDLQNSKADRKIYVGNLPPDITTQQVKTFFFHSQLVDYLNQALKQMNVNTEVIFNFIKLFNDKNRRYIY